MYISNRGSSTPDFFDNMLVVKNIPENAAVLSNLPGFFKVDSTSGLALGGQFGLTSTTTCPSKTKAATHVHIDVYIYIYKYVSLLWQAMKRHETSNLEKYMAGRCGKDLSESLRKGKDPKQEGHRFKHLEVLLDSITQNLGKT